MKKLRVMMLTHAYMIPPDDLTDRNDPRIESFRTEFDVREALVNLGHEVTMIGLNDDITPLRKSIEQWKPDIVFNLMEAFAENGALAYYIVSYLDMMGVPYTGCNPRGLLLASDKSISKQLLTYHRIRVPKFYTLPHNKKVNLRHIAKYPYPMIVKSAIEQGSLGISQASLVTTPEELQQRAEQLFSMLDGDAIVEQYIEGRELYVAVMGNKRLQVLPTRELVFDNVDDNMHRIATYNVKWNKNYRDRWGIGYQFARNLPAKVADNIPKLAKRIYRVLDITSYARLDLRLADDGKIYVLEANPNAAIAKDDDVACSAEKAGLSYEKLIQKILNMGLHADH
ncbi:MAG: ATP-grasp domain-containing protein [Gammaproteobacteria bacterium]|jgi:D-alanine-D-alanine ligase